MKEVNEAYDTIMNSRRGRGSTATGGSAAGATGSSRYSDVRQMIKTAEQLTPSRFLMGFRYREERRSGIFSRVLFCLKRAGLRMPTTAFKRHVIWIRQIRSTAMPSTMRKTAEAVITGAIIQTSHNRRRAAPVVTFAPVFAVLIPAVSVWAAT